MENRVFSVSEFNEQINLLLSQHFPDVAVGGEISELHSAKSDRLLYLTLKDEKAELAVFAFSTEIISWQQLAVGMTVQVFGRPEIYEPRGRFNFHAHDIVPVGEGSLRIAFEKLKKRLETEGLFAPDRKRPLPFFPERIGLLTAPGSRAYSDFVKVLGERMGGLTIVFSPVQVQGVEAPKQIVKAIKYFSHKQSEIDVLVVTRGGGSLEDLAAFNTEEVVRVVYSCPIPVLSAVGHEADISLIDLAADLRASTPSNAAELIISHRADLTRQVSYRWSQIGKDLQSRLRSALARVDRAINVIDRYFQKQQLVVSTLEGRIKRIGVGLVRLSSERRAQLELSWQMVNRQMGFKAGWVKSEIDHRWRLLEGLNPEAVLARGYSVTRGGAGRIIKHAGQTHTGDRILTQLHRGTIESVVGEARCDD